PSVSVSLIRSPEFPMSDQYYARPARVKTRARSTLDKRPRRLLPDLDPLIFPDIGPDRPPRVCSASAPCSRSRRRQRMKWLCNCCPNTKGARWPVRRGRVCGGGTDTWGRTAQLCSDRRRRPLPLDVGSTVVSVSLGG